jgi:hypothetical protein
MGRSGCDRTRFDPKALFSAQNLERRRPPELGFKTTAIDCSAIPPRRNSGLNSPAFTDVREIRPSSVTASVTIGTAQDSGTAMMPD